MNREVIYIKHNLVRKPKYALTTKIIKDETKYFVQKIANQESRTFLNSLINKYTQISRLNLPFKVVNAKLIDRNTVEMPNITGSTLLDILSKSNNEKSFFKELDNYVSIVNKIPNIDIKLNTNFEKLFGEYKKNKKYKSLHLGILDITLENFIRTPDNQLFLIDYEWTYDFPIPIDFVIYRSLLYLCTNIKNTRFKFNLDKLIEKYIENKEDIEFYKNWELNFQREVSKNNLQDDAINKLIYNIANRQKTNTFDIKTLVHQNKDNLEEIQKLNIELSKYQVLPIQEINEFMSFQKGYIWRGLTIYRKIKRYLRNFFINIIKDGPVITFKRIFKRLKHVIHYRKQLTKELNPYKYWLKNNRITFTKRLLLKKELKHLKYQPLISIIMPVYNVDLKWIKKAIKSINNQIYKNWELCIADDASTNPKLIKYLEKISRKKNIKVTFRKRNGHISEASNTALKLAKGEFIAFMDNDDIIHPHALVEVIKVLNKDKNTDLIYSDEDKIDIRDKRMEPFFKPDWSPDLFMSTNYLCHLTVIRKRLVDSVKGFRKGYEGSQDYDLFLRIIEKTKNIKHIPDILYSWRKIPGSTAYEYKEKNYADNTSIKALEDYLKRNNLEGEVTTGLFPGSFRIKYKILGEPLVSILIPTKDKLTYIKRCISSLLQKTTYQNYEIIIIDTNSTNEETLEYYKTLKDNPKIRILKWEKRFNYSAVNNYGVRNANGEYVLLLNNDTEIITPNWIEGMLGHAQRKQIGAVGVKLLYPDDTIQHAGIILGINGGTGKGIAGHAFKFMPREIQGFPVQKDIIRNYSAVTAACLMIKKEKYLEMKGMDEKFRVAFNDVDFGIRLYRSGYYNLYTPYVELYHHESISVGRPEENTRDNDEFSKEIDLMHEKWGHYIQFDNFYNTNLTLSREDFSIKKGKLNS